MIEPTSSIQESRLRIPRGGAALCAVLIFFVLGLATAWSRSLWLDEFHSLHHARNLARGVRPFLVDLEGDNHPPLYFALLSGARAAFGASPLALRLVGLLAGCANVLLVARVARRLAPTGTVGSARSTLWAPLLVAASTLHLAVAAEARMYALLALLTTALLALLLAAVGGERRGGRLALVTAAGLLTHYYFAHALVVLGAAALFACRGAEQGPRRARRITLALGAGVVLAAPWLATGFRHQLLEHAVAPGGTRVSARKLVEALVHLEFHQVSLGPSWLRPPVLAAGGVFLLLLLLGALRLVRSPNTPRGGALLVIAAALVLPLWAALAAALMPRAGFNWTYLSGSIGAAALLAASAADWPWKGLRLAPVAVVVPGLALAVYMAASPGTEDTRGAVAWVTERSAAGDGVVVVDWQPEIFEQGAGWEYYAERTDAELAGLRLAVTKDWDLLRPEELQGLRRVFLVARGLPGDARLWRRLRSAFPVESGERFGYSLVALEFARE